MFLFDSKNVLTKSNVCIRAESILSNRLHLRLLKDCSYGDELAQLGGLAHLGEISPSNPCKNMLSNEK